MYKIEFPKDWQIIRLENISTHIMEKVGERQIETLSISAGIGFVNQAKKFGRELSGNQYVNYTVIRKGDFSFNKGNSKKYPYGCIYLLKDRDIAAVPNAFYCFRIDKQYRDFFDHLFISGYLNYQLKEIINTGVRNDGLFNLYENDFYNCIVPLPPLPEQQAIAKILTETDKLIALKERLITAKQKQKQWLMQKLLTGEIRLSGFSDTWKCTELGKVYEVTMGQSPNSEFYNFHNNGQPLIQGNADIQNRKTIARMYTTQITRFAHRGDIIMSVRAPVGEVAVAVFDCCIGRGVCSIKGNDFIYQYLQYFEDKWCRLSQGSTFDSITGDQINKLKIPLPPLPEQKAIADVLTAADREIELLNKELEQQKLVKKYLMRQLLTGKIRVKGVQYNGRT